MKYLLLIVKRVSDEELTTEVRSERRKRGANDGNEERS